MTTTQFEAVASVYRRVLPGWGFRKWGGIGLVILLISCIPSALIEAEWLELNAVLWRAALWGGVLGFVAGKLIRNRWVGLVALVASGVVFSAAYQSRALPPFQEGAREVGNVVSWWANEQWAPLVDRTPMLQPRPDPEVVDYVYVPHTPQPRPPMPEWEAGMVRFDLYRQLVIRDWPPALVPHEWSHGQILLGSVLALLVWVICALTLWLVTRGNSAWAALLPIGALLGVNVYLTAMGWLYLILAVVLVMLLDGELTLRALERRWSSGKVYSWLAQDWWLWLTGFAVASLVAMSVVLGVTDPRLREWINDLMKPEPVQQAEEESAPKPRPERPANPGVWPRDHLLESSVDLSQEPAMTVRTPGSPPANFYWRATSYDSYTGQGWLRGYGRAMPGMESDLWPADTDPPTGYTLLRQEFRLAFDSRQIYAAGRPVRLNFAAEGIWTDDEGLDLISVQAFNGTNAYQVLSWVPAMTDDELRQSEEFVLPLWVQGRYLSRPETMPHRIVDLAQEVVEGAETDYDKALAIQNYLRANHEYTTELSGPPEGADVVDHFLFEEKRGYCDYFASAMVMMSRAVGIPARLVVGYRMGEYDVESESYQVSMADAHSWPELYFAGVGWIPFEPTAAFAALERGLPENWGVYQPDHVPAEPDWIEPPVPEGTLTARDFLPVGVVLGGLTLIGLIVALGDVYYEWRRRRLPPERLVHSLFVDLVKSGRRLGVPIDASQTPYEFLTALDEELNLRVNYLPEWMAEWKERAEPIREAARTLISVYSEGVYSPRHAAIAEAQRALAVWPAAKWGLMRFRIAAWLQRITGGEGARGAAAARSGAAAGD